MPRVVPGALKVNRRPFRDAWTPPAGMTSWSLEPITTMIGSRSGWMPFESAARTRSQFLTRSEAMPIFLSKPPRAEPDGEVAVEHRGRRVRSGHSEIEERCREQYDEGPDRHEVTLGPPGEPAHN